MLCKTAGPFSGEEAQGVTSLRSPQSCRWLCCVVAMGWVRSQECSSKVVGLSSDGKSNKLCALVVSLRFGHGGVNSLRPRVLKSSALGVSLRFRQGRSERNVFLRSKG